jgi:hypothetical protein
MAATYGRVDFLYMNAGRACRAWRNLTVLQYIVPAMGSMNAQRSGGWPAGRQYIGDLPNSDLRQMMMTVDTNFWGAPG